MCSEICACDKPPSSSGSQASPLGRLAKPLVTQTTVVSSARSARHMAWAHIGVDADSGLVHTVRGTSGNVSDVVEANSLLHGHETDVFADAGYQGAHKRPDAKEGVTWHVAMRPGKRRALDKENKPIDALIEQVEKIKASIRAKVEHPFRVIKRQFGYTKVRYRGLMKNTLQLTTLFALSNLWMVRHQLLAERG